MSVRASITRHILILERLRRSPATQQEIVDFIAARTGREHEEERRSRRTFIRDKEDILLLYGIDISYDRSDKKYRLDDTAPGNQSQRLLEAFDIMNLLRSSDEHAGHVILETRRPSGTEHFSTLEKAIRNRTEVRFDYLSFETGVASERTVRAYALKEFRGRWYLLAQRGEAPVLRTYGLDRISNLDARRTSFERSVPFDPAVYFRDYFGITGQHADGVQEILLRFDALQGSYVKSLPLHSSQELVSEDVDGIVVRLRLYITHDFIMELLSYGSRMQVIAPGALRARIREELAGALKRY